MSISDKRVVEVTPSRGVHFGMSIADLKAFVADLEAKGIPVGTILEVDTGDGSRWRQILRLRATCNQADVR
jgi:hypothetical protein